MYLKSLRTRCHTRGRSAHRARCPPALAGVSPRRRRRRRGSTTPLPTPYLPGPAREVGGGGVGGRGAPRPRGGSVGRRTQRERDDRELAQTVRGPSIIFLYFSEGLWVLSCSKRILQLLGQRVHRRRRMLAIDEKLAHSQ